MAALRADRLYRQKEIPPLTARWIQSKARSMAPSDQCISTEEIWSTMLKFQP